MAGDPIYFEVLVVSKLAKALGVAAVNVDRQVVKEKRAAASNPSKEELRSVQASADIVTQFRTLNRTPVSVVWTGGGVRSSVGTAADLEIHCQDSQRGAEGYQLKSVKNGFGTVRQAYLGAIASHLGVARETVSPRALKACKRAGKRGLGDRLDDVSSFAQMKAVRDSLKKSDPRRAAFEQATKKAYTPFKKDVLDWFTESFNSADISVRRDYVRQIMGVVPGSPLWLSITDDRGHAIYSHKGLAKRVARAQLTAKVQTPNSLHIFVNDVAILRVNSSAANGQGWSQPCLRFFYLNPRRDLVV